MDRHETARETAHETAPGAPAAPHVPEAPGARHVGRRPAAFAALVAIAFSVPTTLRCGGASTGDEPENGSGLAGERPAPGSFSGGPELDATLEPSPSDDASEAGPGEGEEGPSDDASGPGPREGGDEGPDVSEDDWPPAIVEETDQVAIGPDGGTYELLGGEVAIEVDPGTFDPEITVEVKRSLVDVGDDTLVGYIWGPHGTPVDPPAMMTVHAPANWAPPGASVEEGGSLGLYLVLEGEDVGGEDDPDGDGLAPLGNGGLSADGKSMTLEGETGVLGTIVIAAP